MDPLIPQPLRAHLFAAGEQALAFHQESVKATLSSLDAASAQARGMAGAWRSAYEAQMSAASALARVYVDSVKPSAEA